MEHILRCGGDGDSPEEVLHGGALGWRGTGDKSMDRRSSVPASGSERCSVSVRSLWWWGVGGWPERAISVEVQAEKEGGRRDTS
jgi:hypothetical protein